MEDQFSPEVFNQTVKNYANELKQNDKPDPTLEEFEVTDGKDRSKEEIQKLKDLEEVLGVRQSNPYGTFDREIFNEKLSDMSVTEMQSLAMQVGFPPSRDRVALRSGLKKTFDHFLKSHSVGAVFQAQPAFDKNAPNYKELKSLFEI